MSLVELGRFATRVEADLARLTLGAEGIDAVILDAEANSFFGGGGLIWVRLMVIDDDLDDARRVLDEDRA
ncbi:DUF2007 domain-containing protein [Sphingomonas sp. LY160]|uniref:putative signal transducing protein n=1 Tax=Sphingomonas sp. LY160 TaxID=3095342 RepID=UPI002ADEE2A0|nr:DUF2007 domain-containing protein [Sphingomonas sp. LY160]MEA1072460.1 DUF2007 domain-containing protein [Sphingomonas sp. LY160]